MFDRLRIRLRLRGAFEAMDSGFALLRANGRLVYALFLSLYAPVGVALFWLFWSRDWIALLLMWWLKPLFDRPVLHALAKGTFGEEPTIRSSLKEAPDMFRHGVVAGLLWRRFSFNRAFTLPIWQLERQRGRAYRRRAPLLLRRAHGPSLVLTVSSFLMVLAFSISLGVAVIYLLPEGLADKAGGLFEGNGGEPGRLFYLLPVLASAVLEPFYVAGGFGLYLNRRVQLEAWDLDLAFRRLAQRLRAGMNRSVALILLVFLLGAGPALRAQAPPPNPKAELKEVLKAPEFQTWSTERSWHWKQRKSVEPASQGPDLRRFFHGVGLVMKWAIILVAATAVIWFLWRFFLSRGGGWAKGDDRVDGPSDLFGLDIRPGSLPKDVAAAARALWRAGERRACLSLLYRGALARLVHERGLEVPPGATEGDCLRAAAPALGLEAAGYFRELTGAWQALAYAHRESEDGESLCAGWRRHFGADRG
ncbi:MAG: DUF4129 domain-containing protein [Acidobacteria bacterium]|nr:DUF4129 domain-containing protein [Acidobacteriota bacterium]